MSEIEVGCDLVYQVFAPTSFVFNISVATTACQKIISEQCQTDPVSELNFIDVGKEGNRLLRLHLEPCQFRLQYSARVKLIPQVSDPGTIGEIDFRDLPEEVLCYLNPSRYCESDRLTRLALRLFGEYSPGHQRVQAISDWINATLQYEAGSSDERTGACDTLVNAAGVCRDYAHLGIAFCRALCIPARYVSGYAVNLQPPDFHGFFEAYLDGGWYLFDATGKAPRNGLVRIAAGRDASDVSFATIIGNAVMQSIRVDAGETSSQETGDEERAVSTV